MVTGHRERGQTAPPNFTELPLPICPIGRLASGSPTSDSTRIPFVRPLRVGALLAIRCGEFVVLLLGFFFVTAMATFGSGLSTPVLASALRAAGHGGGAVGLALSAYYVGFGIVAVTGSNFVRRVGDRGALGLAGLGLAASLASQTAILTLGSAGLARAGCGASIALFCLSVEPGLGRCSGHNRGLVLGMYLVVMNVSQGFGAGLSSFGLAMLPWAAGAALLMLPAALFFPGGSAAPRTNSSFPDLGALVMVAPGATLAALAGGAATGGLSAVVPIFGERLGMDAEQVSWMLVGIIGMGALVPIPMGMLADRGDRDQVIRGTALVSSGLALLSALQGGLAGVIYLGLAAGVAFALYPLGVGLAQERLGAEGFSRSGGGLMVGFAAGSVLAAPVAGAAVELIGAPALPLWVALAASFAVPGPLLRTALLRVRGRRARAREASLLPG